MKDHIQVKVKKDLVKYLMIMILALLMVKKMYIIKI